MALSIDAFNATVAQLSQAKGGKIPLLATSRPFLSQIMKLQEKAGGQSIKRHLLLGSPTSGTNLTGDGYDAAPLGVRQVKDSIKMEYWDYFVPIQISKKVLAECSDESGLDIAMDYVNGAVEIFYEDVEHRLLTGSARASTLDPVVSSTAQFERLNSFNGATTIFSGGDRGICQLAAVGSQTGVVEGITVSSKWANQYGLGTGWATGTTRNVLDRTINVCRQYTGSNMALDMGVADSISHSKLTEALAENVRVVNVTSEQMTGELALFYKGVKIYDSINLDTTDSAYSGTTAASSSDITGGLIYVFPSKLATFFMSMEQPPKFEWITPNQAVYSSEFTARAQFVADKLLSFGAIAGTRIP